MVLMMNGILLVDKEQGITSYDVIRRLKPLCPKGQKIGHAGTLDPFATGLLVILLGRATKLNESFQKMKKGYITTAEFGYETDTNDPTGEITEKDNRCLNISEEEITEVVCKMTGEMLQTPPIYSAKKVGGKRAYDLARAGKEFKLDPKKVRVFKFEVMRYTWPKVDLEIECSSGTYVRKLVVDLARKLGTYATPVSLRRTFIGDYRVEDAVGSDVLKKTEVFEALIPLNQLIPV